MTLALPLVIALDTRPRGDCEGCGVTRPESELRDGPRLLLRRSYGYGCASDYCWCSGCALGLWARWDTMVRRRSTRAGREQLAHVQLMLVRP